MGQMSNEEAVLRAEELALEEGFPAGISCGAAVAVAVRIAKRPRRVLFETLIDEKGVPELRIVRLQVAQGGFIKQPLEGAAQLSGCGQIGQDARDRSVSMSATR
jgi:hypothetical protein